MSGLDAGLGQLEAALTARRTQLLEELRQLDLDLDAVRRVVDAAGRMRLTEAAVAAAPRSPAARHQARGADRQPSQMSKSPGGKVAPADFDPMGTLGPERDDSVIPPKVDGQRRRLDASDVPTSGPELQALRDGVRGIAAAAAKAPPGPGGRRHLSAKGLVPGDPIVPNLMAVLREAAHPLTSAEAAAAVLEMRGIKLDGPQLVALVNVVSARLSQQARKSRVRRIRAEGSRQVRWVLQENVRPNGSADSADQPTPSRQPNGSMG